VYYEEPVVVERPPVRRIEYDRRWDDRRWDDRRWSERGWDDRRWVDRRGSERGWDDGPRHGWHERHGERCRHED
jgi:hypothetical protein